MNKLFGTDGIRGVAGEYPLDTYSVEKIGRALAATLARDLTHTPEIIIGRDTRESGPQIERAIAQGARAAGARIESAGVITTPGIAYITRLSGFDAGIVISASHNPYQDNGIKVFTRSGRKLPDEMERRIEEEVAREDAGRISESDSFAETGEALHQTVSRPVDYRERYLNYLVSVIGRDLDLSGMRIALDCANGAASGLAPELFERLGADLHVMAASPDGRNINENCGSTHLEGLKHAVIERRLDLGIAFDGDADRALLVDAQGELVDGDRMLLILADYMKSRGQLAGNLVVATVMSNIGLEVAFRERGIEMVRAQVGDRYVLEEMLARGARLGGEQSGHIIFPDISLAGDGMITALEMLRAVCESGRLIAELASAMKRFPQILLNVRVRSKPPIETLPRVSAEIRRLEEEMQGRGRLLVRYSGTENLARVMIEGEDLKTIEEQATRLASVIESVIG
ncbi:MAG: phosphoglucosamine mutase [Blastocatellia bacterium]|nr:phosphoglucosamine mutase [Blastocatellia bacterium]